MKKLLIALAAAFIAVASYGQGQVAFVNRATAAGVDKPIVFANDSTKGPGSDLANTWNVQLYLVGANNALTPLTPISTFRTGAADKYWNLQAITVDGNTGTSANFQVRAWASNLGTFDAVKAAGQGGWGESEVFALTPGVAPNGPANLTTLNAFTVAPVVPEPSVIALGVLGAAALALRRRK